MIYAKQVLLDSFEPEGFDGEFIYNRSNVSIDRTRKYHILDTTCGENIIGYVSNVFIDDGGLYGDVFIDKKLSDSLSPEYVVIDNGSDIRELYAFAFSHTPFRCCKDNIKEI